MFSDFSFKKKDLKKIRTSKILKNEKMSDDEDFVDLKTLRLRTIRENHAARTITNRFARPYLNRSRKDLNRSRNDYVMEQEKKIKSSVRHVVPFPIARVHKDGMHLVLVEDYRLYLMNTVKTKINVDVGLAAACAQSAALAALNHSHAALRFVEYISTCRNLVNNGAQVDVTTMGPVTKDTVLPLGTRVIICRGSNFGETATLISKDPYKFARGKHREDHKNNSFNVPKRSFFKVISESRFRHLEEEYENAKSKWFFWTQRYAFTTAKMANKMSKIDKNKDRLYFMFWFLGSRFDLRIKWFMTRNLGASLPKKINLYVACERVIGNPGNKTRGRRVLTIRLSPAMKLGEFLELCMRYEPSGKFLDYKKLDRPVSMYRSTFELNWGVQNRQHTTKLATFNLNSDWISRAKEEDTLTWYCMNQRLWDLGVRNGDLIEYQSGDESRLHLKKISGLKEFDLKCKNSRKGHKTCFVGDDKTRAVYPITVRKGRLKCWQVDFPEDLGLKDTKSLDFSKDM